MAGTGRPRSNAPPRSLVAAAPARRRMSAPPPIDQDERRGLRSSGSRRDKRRSSPRGSPRGRRGRSSRDYSDSDDDSDYSEDDLRATGRIPTTDLYDGETPIFPAEFADMEGAPPQCFRAAPAPAPPPPPPPLPPPLAFHRPSHRGMAPAAHNNLMLRAEYIACAQPRAGTGRGGRAG